MFFKPELGALNLTELFAKQTQTIATAGTLNSSCASKRSEC